VLGIQARHVFRGTQLGYIDSQIAVSMNGIDLTMIEHRSKNWNMEDNKMVLIAFHMLGSSISAYIE
jgi:hypothetical protein